MTPRRVSAALAILALALIVAGIALLAGPAWALIAAGIGALVGAVVLYDPADKHFG